jgi:hypothetical protein
VKFILCLLLTAVACHAAPQDPATAALDFFEKIRLGKLNLTPGGDTALSAHTTEPKRAAIGKRLERIRSEIGSDSLEIGPVKIDANIAAAIVRKIGAFDPNEMQVFSVALVKRGDSWLPAPVLASFENADAGGTLALQNRLVALENWMLREQVSDLEQLRNQVRERLRQKIQLSLPLAELKAFTAEQAAQRFLVACEKHDLPSLLGMIGGLAEEPTADWPQRLKAAEDALKPNAPLRRYWVLLTAPGVARAVVNSENSATSGSFSIACLDPAGPEETGSDAKVVALNFALMKGRDGLWQVSPDDAFFDEETSIEETENNDEETQNDLVDAFAEAWAEAHPAQPQASAIDAQQAFTRATRAHDFSSLLSLANLSDEASGAKKPCLVAAELWHTLHAPASACEPLLLELHQNDEAAVCLYQFFVPRNPDRTEIRSFYFTNNEGRWLWKPSPTEDQIADFREVLAADTKQWTDTWQRDLLAGSVEIDEIGGNPLAEPAAAQKLVDDWFQALQAGEIKAALALTAHLPDPKGNHPILRNLGHEIAAIRKADFTLTPAAVLQGKVCTAVGMKLNRSGKLSHPLYPVIQTIKGPRILLEIDLFAAPSRSFLNKTSLARLKEAGFAAATEDLEALVNQFQKSLEPSN